MFGRALPPLVVASLLWASTLPALALDPPVCNGVPATMWGTAQADRLVGTDGPDVIVGLGGDDRIFGLGGDDLLCGDAGSDTLVGGPGADTVRGGGDSDVIRGGAGDDVLVGGSGNDAVRGGGGNDLIRGGAGDDVLQGFGGRDVLIGGEGSDAISGGRAADVLRGNSGTDFLLGGDDADSLRGGAAADVLVGGEGEDQSAGGRGADLCSQSPASTRCETVDPGLWDWVRTAPAIALADRFRDLLVLQIGCDSGLDLEWAGLVTEAFPDPGHDPLTGAVDDLSRSAAACNADPDEWRTSLRDALVHLEAFTSLVAGGPPRPVGPLATPGEAATAAIDISQAITGYLRGGNPPSASSDFWWGMFQAGHARQLEVAVSGGGFDVLFVGSSTVVGAAIPSLFTDLDGRTAYNASLPASGPEVQASWVLEYAVPLADPDLVIIGVEDRSFLPFDEVPGSCAQANDSWFEAREMRRAAFERVTALAASSEGALFFGDPAASAPTRPLAQHDFFSANVSPLGNRDTLAPNLTIGQKQAQLSEILPWSVGFAPCDERIATMGVLATDLGALGIEVVVVMMPTSDIRASAFDPAGEGDVDAGRAVIDDLAAKVEAMATGTGAGFVDLSNDLLITEDLFRDSNHLSGEGGTTFTTLLVNALELLR